MENFSDDVMPEDYYKSILACRRRKKGLFSAEKDFLKTRKEEIRRIAGAIPYVLRRMVIFPDHQNAVKDPSDIDKLEFEDTAMTGDTANTLKSPSGKEGRKINV